jgi:hypothetical protein
LCTYFSDLIERRISCNAIPPKLQPAAGALLEALRLDGNTSELSGAADTK